MNLKKIPVRFCHFLRLLYQEVVKMVKVPGKLIKETKAMIRLYLFLRHECGLKEEDGLSVRELKELLGSLSLRQE